MKTISIHLPILNRLISLNILYVLLLTLGIIGCTSYQHPDLDPRQVGWQPDRDLTPYLDTEAKIQSLENLRGTKAKLDSLLEWADLLNYQHENEARTYADEAYNLALEKGYRFSQAIAMYYRALIKGRGQILGEGIEDALADIEISKRLLKSTDPADWQVKIYDQTGYLYYRNRRFDETFVDSAQHYTDIALDLLDKKPVEEKTKAYLYAQVYKDQATLFISNDSLKAATFFDKSIEKAKEANNEALQAAIWRAFGEFLRRKKNKKKAEEAFLISKDLAIESGDKLNIVTTYQRIANLKGIQFFENLDTSLFNESMRYLKKCLPLQTSNLYYTYALIGYNYDDYLYLSGNPPTNYTSEGDSAFLYYTLALREAIKEGALNFMETTVKNINVLCEHKSRLTNQDCNELLSGDNYYNYLNQNYASLVDTMRSQLQKSNTRLQQFEIRKSNVINGRRLNNSRIIFFTILAFALLIFLYLIQIQQKKRLQARMAALRAQINPHFMSNSLNAIENLVNMNRNNEASKYLIHFSRLSRKLLSDSRASYTSLKAELQTLEHFLALEKLRFRDKLNYHFEISPQIDPEEVEIPALLLQPYIENAIIHGIKPKQGPGHLKISAQKEGNHLICSIEDDGIGRKKAAEIKRKSALPGKRKSHGMKINEERLKIIGKTKNAKVSIVDLYDDNGNGTGTRVVIKIPYKLKVEN